MRHAILTAAFIAVAARADNLYIVPVAGNVTGALGEYSTAIRAVNPNATEVTLTCDGVFPMFSEATSCAGLSVTIPPAATREGITIGGEGSGGAPFDNVPVGALALRSTYALELRSDVLLISGTATSWQPMEIGRAWIPGGREAFIDRAFAFDESRTNLFLVNPNSFPIHVAYRSFQGSADAIVPARRTLFVPLSYKFPCPTSCGSVLPDFSNGLGLYLRSDFDYFASAISFSRLLPTVVRIAVPISP
jgi:hypothetical protein